MRRPDAPRIVHVTADFPDPVEPHKTDAIRRLVELTAGDFAHTVFSLNRRSPGLEDIRAMLGLGGEESRIPINAQAFEDGQAVAYRAPPKGLFHQTCLNALGDWLAERIMQGPDRPDLIVAHKLTIEGLAVHRAATATAIPFALSLQGNTDGRLLQVRPDLRAAFARAFHDARTVFAFAPWILRDAEKALGPRKGPTHLLPCATPLDGTMPPRPGGNGFITAFHLRNWQIKNLDRTLAAHRRLRRSGGAQPLAVIGGGSEADLRKCRALAHGDPQVAFEGPLAHSAVPARFNAATALVMPSRRESFGMVFVEALFAGLPIIYPAGRAVDGYFDGAEFALPVDPGSTAAIAEAMDRAVTNEVRMKSALAEWQASGEALRFTRTAIAKVFRDGLYQALGRAA